MNSWDQLDNGFKALFGLIGVIGTFLGIGKVFRMNKLDGANNAANIAGAETEQVAAHTVSYELERLSQATELLQKKIDELSARVTELSAEVHRLNNSRQTALTLLKRIDLKAEDPHEKFQVLLDTAIINLESRE